MCMVPTFFPGISLFDSLLEILPPLLTRSAMVVRDFLSCLDDSHPSLLDQCQAHQIGYVVLSQSNNLLFRCLNFVSNYFFIFEIFLFYQLSLISRTLGSSCSWSFLLNQRASTHYFFHFWHTHIFEDLTWREHPYLKKKKKGEAFQVNLVTFFEI